ncbi:hypothetical protein LCGC14_3106630, partial [marine sediment metagenome]
MSQSRLTLYVWRDLDTPSDVKRGEHFTDADDYEQDVRDYIRKDQGKRKYRWDNNKIEVCGIWDVSKYAKKVGRFYSHSRIDDYIRERIGYRISSKTEFHRPPCSPDKAGEWIRNRISIILSGARVNFSLRSEQESAVRAAVKYFRNRGKDFLLNCKPRFGKTFATY